MRKPLILLALASSLILFSCGEDIEFGSPVKPGQESGSSGDNQEDDKETTTVLFGNGEKIGDITYVTFRIPSLVRTKNKIFAFCEARTVDSERGDIDIAYRVSTDDGKTWGEKKVLFSDANHTVGNACCIYTSSGRLVIVFNWHVANDGKLTWPSELGVTYAQNVTHSRRVFVTWSDDEGTTWEKPKDITDAVMEKAWTWNAAGPCHGIQIQNGKYKGRLVVPCDNKYSGTLPDGRDSYVIYSDDDGITWNKSKTVKYGNESCVVERSDGKLHLDMRNSNSVESEGGKPYRGWSLSSDGGETWNGFHVDESRPEPTPASLGTRGCQGTVINYNPDGAISSNIVFANPANTTTRKNMTMRFSVNNAENWQKSKLVTANYAGYSDLVVLKDGGVGLFYETGISNYHQTIAFLRIPKNSIQEYFK